MNRWVMLGFGVCAGLSVGPACGGSDDAGLDGQGGSGKGGSSSGGTSSGGNAGSDASVGGAGGSTGGASSGGTGGASTGGASSGGANTGGANTGGASTGGANTGGASTGGAGSGGTGGANTGGTGGGGSAGCPTLPPISGNSCSVPGAVCCYGPSPLKPLRCVPTSADGGAPYKWATLQSKECCPVLTPALGTPCNTPGDLACCYIGSDRICNNQPEPDVWAVTTCN